MTYMYIAIFISGFIYDVFEIIMIINLRVGFIWIVTAMVCT